jgi:hypothetical protein
MKGAEELKREVAAPVKRETVRKQTRRNHPGGTYILHGQDTTDVNDF